ncbi:Thiol:disulfide interchange protein DsbC precursor [Marinomonas aquimarina]|uniref:Thiol:disulfide interchange protein n=1 Tax=Marinomonas aquimarina TaxID=295068 RepID=A0A1A8TLZ0_9GAMM|nr:thioredoxin fold domain-containing protein [Marinomonas aquimarina]SBS34107.1 Thiol:disulfide interchange protein DsbC precursor [Marinomonas aquimarina]
MGYLVKTVSAVALTLLGMTQVQAGEQEVRAAMAKALPQYSIESMEAHQGSGLYVVTLNNGPILHVTADGKYFVAGDLYQVDGQNLVNETEQKKLAKIEQIPESEMVVFKAANEKAHISVFTDISCGYCRMLHKDIEELNELGVTVRYLAYPRAGVGSEAYNEMVNIWCSDDPKKWMTAAKLGKDVPDNKCTNPVANQYRLGNAVGVRGTPSIILDNGKFIPGYLPAKELAKELEL